MGGGAAFPRGSAVRRLARDHTRWPATLSDLPCRAFALQMGAVDLREVVQAAVATTRPLFEAARPALTAQVPAASCGVLGDRARLEQVVINLLANANKYAPPGTPVAVRDHGPGVPPEEREPIFARFNRSRHHRTDRPASTGLGLAIARQIAEMHQGRVGVTPAPGGGSIFTLALPGAV